MKIRRNTFKIKWNSFREEVLKIDKYTCVKCGRSFSENIILQVHHKKYKSGKLPWEYSHFDCETLCKRCHGEIHGKILPQSGWTYLYHEDFGEVSSNCEYCNTSIRYVFYISHPNWEPLAVGTICCNDLTGNDKASKERKKNESYRRRLKTFVESPKWFGDNKIIFIDYKNYFIEVVRKHDKYQLVVDAIKGKNVSKQYWKPNVKYSV